MFGGPVCAERISNCPLDRVLTYKNLIYLLNLQVKHSYHSSPIKISPDLALSSPDSLRIQGPSKIQLWPLIQSLLSKNPIERVEMLNLSGFTIACFLIPKPHQGWRPVTELSRLNTQGLNGKSIRASDSRVMGVVDRPCQTPTFTFHTQAQGST